MPFRETFVATINGGSLASTGGNGQPYAKALDGSGTVTPDAAIIDDAFVAFKSGASEVVEPVILQAYARDWGGGTLEVTARSAAEIAKLKGLVECDATLLIETAFGEAFYARITKPAWARSGTVVAPRRPASLDYAQVARPPVV